MSQAHTHTHTHTHPHTHRKEQRDSLSPKLYFTTHLGGGVDGSPDWSTWTSSLQLNWTGSGEEEEKEEEEAGVNHSEMTLLNFPSPAVSHLFSPQEQFEFALTAVAEEVNAILKALPQ